LRKAFLRSPVDFARISSHFNLKRRHPILHTIRAHKGVDYAARTGTPIKATGDGKVIHAGRKGGYGRTVILQHGQKYTTLYAHLHRYAKGIKAGKRVEQGQIIGYVGSSGLATGPHLHYEFRTNGVHVNPLTVKIKQSDPIDQRFKADFHTHAQTMLAQLAPTDDGTRYASASTELTPRSDERNVQ
jgi:murein DD-endopeptidase MepM/ murein hydrolase activator NlpD